MDQRRATQSPPLPLTIYFLIRDFFAIGRRARQKKSSQSLDRHLGDASIARLAIDCGANVGNITSKFVAAGFRVHAFEPDPTARDALIARAFSADQVRIYPTAVGVRRGIATLFRRKKKSQTTIHTAASSLVDYGKTNAQDNVDVEIIDFIAYIQQLGERVGILKMDIEGSEVDILNALIDGDLLSKIDFAIVETHERFNRDLAWRTAKLRARLAHLKVANVNLDHL